MTRNFLFTITLLSTLPLADDHTIAVLDFTGEGIHEEQLKYLGEIFRVELLRQDTLRVMDYKDMSSTLAIAGYDKPQCTTIECAVISSMLLESEWMVTVHISKISDVYVSEARLYESHTGRIINVTIYDYDLSLEGLQTQGMHNLAEMMMSTRIPIEVHKGKELVYIKTKPSRAFVRVGKDTLSGVTPMAIDRVVAESRPIIILKEGYQPFRLKHLPEDQSNIVYIELQHLVPQIGDVAFAKPLPANIVIVSSDSETRFLIDEGALEYYELSAGLYSLESDQYIIHNGDFRIHHRRTSHIKPELHEIALIEKQMQGFKLKRNILIGFLVVSAGYRGYLQYESENIYREYGDNILEADIRHTRIEELDRLKPIFDGISVFTVFPVIYYHAKYLQMKRWLGQ